MSSDNKATEVLYALRGIDPPLDAAGVLITEGAWVIRAITMGQTASLIFARAFPAPEPAGGARHPTPATHVNVTTYGVSTDVKSYRRAVMQRGVVQHAYRMLVINEEQVPAVIRAALSGPEDELKARYKARTKIAVGE